MCCDIKNIGFAKKINIGKKDNPIKNNNETVYAQTGSVSLEKIRKEISQKENDEKLEL